jgi:hypothetical protein
MEALIALRVDGTLTNFPDRLEELLGNSAAGGKSGGKLSAEDYAACRTTT